MSRKFSKKLLLSIKLSERSAKLHPFTGTKRRERWNYGGLVLSFAERSLWGLAKVVVMFH